MAISPAGQDALGTQGARAAVQHAFKKLAALALGIAIVLGLSYSAEVPKYRFQEDAAETGRVIPGARLVNAIQSTELVSPVSWFWPATTTWNFAWPDLAKQNRFYAVTLNYGEDDPVVLLVDTDCETGTAELYDLDEPDSALPALTTGGEPVVAPNGKTYRRTTADRPFPATWIRSFCDTDWTREKASIAAAPNDASESR